MNIYRVHETINDNNYFIMADSLAECLDKFTEQVNGVDYESIDYLYLVAEDKDIIK